jgi:hypothetical protein
MDEPTIGVLRSLQREKIEVTEMRISDLINAIEDVLASKDQQIERYREAGARNRQHPDHT